MKNNAATRVTGRELWRERAHRNSNKTFLRVGESSWTYGETSDVAARYATTLKHHGVQRGTHVMVGLQNSAPRIFIQIAVMQLGAVLVPVQSELTFSELAHQIHDSDATVVIANQTMTDTLDDRYDEFIKVKAWLTSDSSRPPSIPAFQSWSSLSRIGSLAPTPWQDLPDYTDLEPALILYTSGSSGRPKGVVLPAGCVPSVGEAFSKRYSFGPHDIYFLPLTMAHAIGSLSALAMTIFQGASIVVAQKFSPRTFWAEVKKSCGTHTILFPAHLTLLTEATEAWEASGTTLKTIITHKDHPEFIRKFGGQDRFEGRLATIWGMTETGAMSAGCAPGEITHEDGFIGEPMGDVSIEIRDDQNVTLPVGVTGEICIKHRHVLLHYHNNMAATRDVFTSDGWVRTGDRGLLNSRGELIYQGRLKNMIKRAGENISPEEVQNALAKHPQVVESHVFGVPDRIRTEEVAAVIVIRGPAKESNILSVASRDLVRWKLPRFVELTGEPLIRLVNGKVDSKTIQKNFDPSKAYDHAIWRKK